MIVTCEACGTSYTLKASLLDPSGSTVRCSNCQHVFTVYPDNAGEEPADAAQSSPDSPDQKEVTLNEILDEDVTETEKELDALFAEDNGDALDEETEELAATVEALDLLEEEEEEDDWVSEIGPELEEFDEEIRRTTEDSDILFEDEDELEDLPDENEDIFAAEPSPTADTTESSDVVGLEALSTEDIDTEDAISLKDLEGKSDAGYELLTETAEGESVADYELLTETAEGESVTDYELLTETAEDDSSVPPETTLESFDQDENAIDLKTFESPEANFEGKSVAAAWEGETAADEDIVGLEELEGRSEAGYELLTETAEGESLAGYELLTETAEGESSIGYELLTETAEGESAAGYEILTETAEGESVAGLEADEKEAIVDIGELGERTVEEDLLDIDQEEFDLDEILAEEDAIAEKDISEAGYGIQPDDIEWVEQKEREIEEKGGLLAELGDDGKKADSKKPRVPKDTETGEEDFDLDLEFEEPGKAAETQGVDDSELGLDLDLDEFDLDIVEEETTDLTGTRKKIASELAQGDEFDLDIEEATGGLEEQRIEEKGFEEEEFDLDLDLDETAETAEKTAEAAEEEFDLDLEFEPATIEGEEESAAETLIADESLELDLETEAEETVQKEAGQTEEEFDLDLDETAESEITVVGKTDEEFELDLEFGETAEGAAEEEEGEFELDLDLEPGGATAESAEEEFPLDLDMEESLVTTEATAQPEESEDFELDLDIEEESPESPGAEIAEADEFFDLDLEEAPVESEESEAAEEFDLGLEKTAEPAKAEGAEDEFDLDIETMLDEEAVAEGDKEISLETISDSGVREEYKGADALEQEEAELEMEAWTQEAAEPEEAATPVPEAAPVAPVEPIPGPEEIWEEKEPGIEKAPEPVTGLAKKRIPGKKAIILVLAAAALLALVIVGAYLMFGKKTVEHKVQDMGNLQIEISEIPAYRFVRNEKAGELLVVSGTVTNRYDHARKRIKVQANLYDASGKLIRTSRSLSGISLTDNELKSLDIKTIEDKLNNRKGNPKLDVVLNPGQKTSFTVVFSNLPDNMDELSCEVIASSESAPTK